MDSSVTSQQIEGFMVEWPLCQISSLVYIKMMIMIMTATAMTTMMMTTKFMTYSLGCEALHNLSYADDRCFCIRSSTSFSMLVDNCNTE